MQPLIDDLVSVVMDYRGPVSLRALTRLRSQRGRTRYRRACEMVYHLHINDNCNTDCGDPITVLSCFPRLRTLVIQEYHVPRWAEALGENRRWTITRVTMSHHRPNYMVADSSRLRMILNLCPHLQWIDCALTHSGFHMRVDGESLAVLQQLLDRGIMPWQMLKIAVDMERDADEANAKMEFKLIQLAQRVLDSDRRQCSLHLTVWSDYKRVSFLRIVAGVLMEATGRFAQHVRTVWNDNAKPHDKLTLQLKPVCVSSS